MTTRAQQATRQRTLIAATHARADGLLRQLAALRNLNARRRARLAVLERPPKPQFGLDWAWGTMPVRALQASGATFACRYLSHDPSKDLSASEARALSKADVQVVVVWETTANRASAGQAAGRADAEAAWLLARTCGMPEGAPIFFAVDFDAAGPDIAEYFAGAKSYLGLRRTGVYGGIRVVRYLLDQRQVAYAWQTYAWSGGQWDPRAQLQQYSNGHKVGGVDVDYNRAVHTDYGGWRVTPARSISPR